MSAYSSPAMVDETDEPTGLTVTDYSPTLVSPFPLKSYPHGVPGECGCVRDKGI